MMLRPELVAREVDATSLNTDKSRYRSLARISADGKFGIYQAPVAPHLVDKSVAKILTAVILTVFLVVAFIFPSASSAQQTDNDFKLFWEKFKTSVINSDKNAVASLSKFPIGMSYGIRSIKTKTEFLRRYKELFNKQTDAAKCFAAKEPERDSANARKYSVACPDAAGNEVVIYEFELRAGVWKFVRLDNINE